MRKSACTGTRIVGCPGLIQVMFSLLSLLRVPLLSYLTVLIVQKNEKWKRDPWWSSVICPVGHFHTLKRLFKNIYIYTQ